MRFSACQIVTVVLAFSAFESVAQTHKHVPLERSSNRNKDAGKQMAKCDRGELRKVRKDMDRLVSDANLDEAIKRAEKFDESCWGSLMTAKTPLELNDIEDYYWIQSGAMLAASKLGRTDKCIKIGLESTKGYYGNPFTEYRLASKSVGKAILHNLKSCNQNRDQAYVSVNLRPCPVSLNGKSLKAWELPSEWGTKLGAICVALEANFTGTQDEMEAEEPDLKLCPGIRLVDTRQKGVVKFESLVAKNGELSSCQLCGYDNLSISNTEKGHFLRIRGDLSYCGGGTGAITYDGIYELKGRDLVLVNEMVAALH